MTTGDTTSETTRTPADTDEVLAAALAHDLPEFATVMRGYDRGQVEDYVVRLQEFLHDSEQRAANADRRVAQTQSRIEGLERELTRAAEVAREPGATYDGLGERISTILRLAAEEAEGLKSTARSEADSIVEEARRDAERGRVAAEHALNDLSRRRDQVVAELNRVRDILTTLGLSKEAAEDGEPKAGRAGSDPAVVIDLSDRQTAQLG
jgi:cell division septum initiation protein DivIVA